MLKGSLDDDCKKVDLGIFLGTSAVFEKSFTKYVRSVAHFALEGGNRHVPLPLPHQIRIHYI